MFGPGAGVQPLICRGRTVCLPRSPRWWPCAVVSHGPGKRVLTRPYPVGGALGRLFSFDDPAYGRCLSRAFPITGVPCARKVTADIGGRDLPAAGSRRGGGASVTGRRHPSRNVRRSRIRAGQAGPFIGERCRSACCAPGVPPGSVLSALRPAGRHREIPIPSIFYCDRSVLLRRCQSTVLFPLAAGA